MQLYEIYSLADVRYPQSGCHGYLKAPAKEDVIAMMSKDRTYREYLAAGEFTDIRYTVNKASDYRCANIDLVGDWKCAAADQTRPIKLAGITISAVSSNCGAVHISNMYSDFRNKGLGTQVLNEVVNWCKTTGYTMIFGNTAGSAQNSYALPFFIKNGFVKMGKAYRNLRSDNTNIWFYQFIQECNPKGEYEDEEIFDEDEDEDEEDF